MHLPLLFASNAFVDPESMPSWLRVVAEANPISYANDAMRSMVAGQASLTELLTTVGVSCVLFAVCAPIANRSFRVL